MVKKYVWAWLVGSLLVSNAWTQKEDSETTPPFVIEFKNTSPLKGAVNSYAEETYPMWAPNNILYFNRAFHHKNMGGEGAGQDIWLAKPTEKRDSLTEVHNDFSPINSIKSNAVIGFAKNGNRVFLMNTTAADNKEILPGISYSDFADAKWTQPVPMKTPGIATNSQFYSAHVFNEGTTAILSLAGLSQEAGGHDLYLIHLTDTGWSLPLLLPPTLNTSGDEISPFFDQKNNILYFASNALPGAQGFDIYYALPKNQSFTEFYSPVRLPNNINSQKFDAYFSIVNDSLALFASNKDALLSDLFITNWQKKDPTKDLLAQRDTIYIYDTIYASFKVEKNILGQPIEAIAYFDLDKRKYQQTFDLNMDSIADYLTMYPSIKVALSGHTCNLGPAGYNETLSKDRAQYVKDNLIRRGIEEQRISIRWFGATRPIRPNTNSHNRKFNRRVEFRFIIPEQSKVN